MPVYKIHKYSLSGESVFLNTGIISSGFTGQTGAGRYFHIGSFVFPLDGKTYNCIEFNMDTTEIFQFTDVSRATPLVVNAKNATDSDFQFYENQPDDWDAVQGLMGSRYWNYRIDTEVYGLYAGNVIGYPAGGLYADIDNKFGYLAVFENGVNFYIGQNNTGTNPLFNAFTRAAASTRNADFGKISYGNTRLGGDTDTYRISGFADFDNAYLCTYTHDGKTYVGVLAINVDNFGSHTYAEFVGAEQAIFGEFAKPEFQDENGQQGGLRGTYDKTSAGVGFPDGSAISSIMSSFVAGDGAGYHIYSLPAAGLSAFVAGFYKPDLFTTLENVTYNVTDCIVNAQILPVVVSTDNGAHPIHAAGVTIGTAVAASVSQTVVNVDCGAVDLSGLYFDTYLDYGDYTTIKLFLPFVGFVDIPSNKCMGGSLHLYANVDVITGNILYGVIATDRHGISELINQSDGQCGISVPLVSSMKNIGGVAGATIGGIAAVATMNPIAIGYAAVNAASLKNSETGLLTKFSGSAGSMGCMQPYVLISRPCPSIPKDGSASYLNMWGTTSEIMTTVSQCSGYLRAHSVRMDAVEDATADEKEEIRRLLNDGIYV